jgi:hypothetical protein
MDLAALIATIRTTADCVVFPPSGLPVVEPDHQLPDDLLAFYRICGGIDLFTEAAFPTRIATPAEFTVATPVIFNGVPPEDLAATLGEPSWSWYIVAYGPNSHYITVDLDPSRLGTYYNSFWMLHPGNSPVIARSLAEVLSNLLATAGAFYWFDDNPPAAL